MAKLFEMEGHSSSIAFVLSGTDLLFVPGGSLAVRYGEISRKPGLEAFPSFQEFLVGSPRAAIGIGHIAIKNPREGGKVLRGILGRPQFPNPAVGFLIADGGCRFINESAMPNRSKMWQRRSKSFARPGVPDSGKLITA